MRWVAADWVARFRQIRQNGPPDPNGAAALVRWLHIHHLTCLIRHHLGIILVKYTNEGVLQELNKIV